ncbi:hypothetical protein HOLDEFILI_02583 [Holdemania filiformis DSM 12042]|uniref:Uncharacterized protein n=1 Tax=Holdemania filiformis DSM 12042 TaxID=545696 RepID=B9Y9S7_9FIRM|nr:hypothetical protein HOLDEFILI_02583 [Holdemania filiformis DSM 12042]
MVEGFPFFSQSFKTDFFFHIHHLVIIITFFLFFIVPLIGQYCIW